METEVPKRVIIDTGWLWRYQDLYPWFFVRYPIRDLLSRVIAIPYDIDFDDVLWDDIETKLNMLEIEQIDPDKLSLYVETISERFYRELSQKVNTDKYEWIFEKWVDRNSMVLQRTETTL